MAALCSPLQPTVRRHTPDGFMVAARTAPHGNTAEKPEETSCTERKQWSRGAYDTGRAVVLFVQTYEQPAGVHGADRPRVALHGLTVYVPSDEC